MKNIAIISCYADSPYKKSILLDYIRQFKKLSNTDILLVSHIPLPEHILNEINYFIYDSDNFLLPLQNTPVSWFVYNKLKINILSCRHGFAFMKNVNNALKFVKSLGYDKFIFSDYDNILNDEDLFKISNIPQLLDQHGKKMFVFKNYNRSSPGGYSYESKFFAGDVNYFVDAVPLPVSYDDWLNIEPYKSSSNIVEEILVSLFNKFENELYIIEDNINSYFSKSQIDIFHHFNKKYSLIYNLNDKFKPLFFYITSEDGEFELIVNNQTIFKVECNKSNWLLHFIDINEIDTEIVFKYNNEILFDRIVNINTIENLKSIAYVQTV
jgi:hypothetical protein